MSKKQHVVPNSERGGWDVRGAGNSRATSHHNTKSEAIDAGREIAKNQSSELLIHKRDGKIAERNSYGNDPNPPKG